MNSALASRDGTSLPASLEAVAIEPRWRGFAPPPMVMSALAMLRIGSPVATSEDPSLADRSVMHCRTLAMVFGQNSRATSGCDIGAGCRPGSPHQVAAPNLCPVAHSFQHRCSPVAVLEETWAPQPTSSEARHSLSCAESLHLRPRQMTGTYF